MWLRSWEDLVAVSRTWTHTLIRTGWSEVFLWCFSRIVRRDANSPRGGREGDYSKQQGGEELKECVWDNFTNNMKI